MINSQKLQHDVDMILTDIAQDANSAFNFHIEKTDNGYNIGRCHINKYQSSIATGFQKTLYDVYQDDVLIAGNLSLIESALGIVKHQAYTAQISKVAQVIELDSLYAGLMYENYAYRMKDRHINDVDVAKHASHMSRMSSIKQHINKLLNG